MFWSSSLGIIPQVRRWLLQQRVRSRRHWLLLLLVLFEAMLLLLLLLYVLEFGKVLLCMGAHLCTGTGGDKSRHTLPFTTMY